MKNKSASQSVLIGLFAVLTFAVCSSPAWATSTTWIAGSGDWFNCSNWDNGCPGYTTDAFINNAGKAQISSTGAIAQSLTLGLNAGDSGTVLVDSSGTLFLHQTAQDCANNIPGVIYVGYRGTGTLQITNGGQVTSGYGYIGALASSSAPSSAVTVSGTGSTWTLSGVCSARLFISDSNGTTNGGAALLTVKDGGTVIVNNPSGLISVSVGPSGTLTGNGTITANGTNFLARLTAVHGTLAPSGTLTFNGDIAVTGTGTMQCNVTPQAADNVDISRTATLQTNSRLSVTMTGTFTPGTQFTLLHAHDGLDPTQNRFTSVSITYPPVPTYTPVITYDANNVYLYLRPN